MHLFRYFILKSLNLNFLSQIFFKFIYFFYLNNEDRIKLRYYKKKFSVLDSSTNSNQLCVFNNLFSSKNIETITFYMFILNIFRFANLKPAVFSSFKFYDLIQASNIQCLPPLLSYNQLLFNSKFKFNSIDEIKKYKWKKVSCGIFSLSSTFRELKSEEFDINNLNHKIILEKNLNKSINYVDSIYNFLNKNKIGSAVFSDPGYVGQGEMFEIFTNKNIPCYQFFMSVDENKMIFKKYLKKNQKEHFDKISSKNWNIFKKKNKFKSKSNKSLSYIKNLYLKNNWFPSVGTTRSQKFFTKNKILKLLNIDKSKPIAVIFNHIFWDGTFFYGEDAFSTYREWFLETIKVAYKNKNINWIIKPHPANKVQNSRYGIQDTITEEEKIILKQFGFIPDNLKVLKTNNQINSWSLYQILHYCITIRGTPGIESALFGAETIITGSGRYEDKGFAKYFKKIKKYLNYLSNLRKAPNKQRSSITNAKLYAEIAFLKKPMTLDSISVKFKKLNS